MRATSLGAVVHMQKSFSDLYQNKNNINKIFFYRVCGTGMGAGAYLLKEMGKDISGTDIAFYPPMSDFLEQAKIDLHEIDQVDQKFLQNFDLVVIGNVVPREGKYGAKIIEESGVDYCSLPDALRAMALEDLDHVIGVAGTHGKTTTSYFLVQLLEALGEDVGYLIGGVIEGRNSAHAGKSQYFVIEADEYDSAYFQKISKLRLYGLDHMILTSLEFDHGDIFENLNAIEEQFDCALQSMTKSLIINREYGSCVKLAEKHRDHFKKCLRYGNKKEEGPNIIESKSTGTVFELKVNGEKIEFHTNLVGEHNILNISSCILFAESVGFDLDKIKKAIVNLEMVKRRQEFRGYYKEAIVIDDFAHHPRAVEMTIESIKQKYHPRKVLAIFEPNSWTSRSPIFQNEFAVALAKASESIVVNPTKKSHLKDLGKIDCQQLCYDIQKNGGGKSLLAKTLNELVSLINQKADESQVLLIMSNGTCMGLWESKFISEICN